MKKIIFFLFCLFILLIPVTAIAADTYTFVAKWGSSGSGDGQFNQPAGVAVDSSGNIYVADYSNHRIQKLRNDGTFLMKWGSYGSGSGQFNHPLIVAIDSLGNVYVADTWNQRIQKFSSSGTFLTKWGSSGSGDGQFQDPNSVAVDPSGNLYVADLRNNRIQKFSSSGNFITKWGSYGSRNGQFNHPRDVTVDSSGNVYVADANNDRIQKFSSSGTFLTTWGSSGSGNGQFNTPCGIAVDSLGNVFVSDYQNNRIQKFSSSGTFLTTWGSSGSGDGQFDLPNGIAVDSSGNVYIADADNNRIQKFSIQTGKVTPTTSVQSSSIITTTITVSTNDQSNTVIQKVDETQSKQTFESTNIILLILVGGVIVVFILFWVIRKRTSHSIPKSDYSQSKAEKNLQPVSVHSVDQFTPKSTTMKQLPPDLADKYTEAEFIGKGGFARVFKAKRKDGQYVAVKIPISIDELTGKSFIAEIQNWTRLSHPNIVRLFDFNIMPMPYFEEELCDNALADQSKPIEIEEAAWILFNVCEGLKFAHDRKIIHRDLKPQNILLKNGVPKISDWGLSRIISESTTTSATSFTPYYAAPEQIGNKVKDERTDIWQLGVILYELVTGVLPFSGDSMVEIGMNIATKDPIPPGLIKPDAKVIDSVVMKCLEKDPKKRYPSVLELQKDLAMYLRENYAELLKTSVSVQDYNRSSYYCGDLVMVNLLTGDTKSAYKYLLDLVHYSKGDVKAEAQELSEQIKMRMDMGVTEIPDELIQKAEIIVHQVSVGFRKKG